MIELGLDFFSPSDQREIGRYEMESVGIINGGKCVCVSDLMTRRLFLSSHGTKLARQSDKIEAIYLHTSI